MPKFQDKEVYNIAQDSRRLRILKETWKKRVKSFGKDVIVPCTEMWSAGLEKGEIPCVVLDGIIMQVYMSGHNDFPEMEILSNQEVSIWPCLGDREAYHIGDGIKIFYIEYPNFWKYGGMIKEKSKLIYKIIINHNK